MFAMGPGFFQQAGSSYATLALTGAFSSSTVGVAYSSSIPITGGLEPYSLTGGTGIASGSLDSGFALSITGTTGARFLTLTCASPATADTMSFTASIDSTDAQTATSPQSVVVSVATTWNPLDKASLIVLSSGNLVAGRTGADTYQSARATASRSSGKNYFEAVVGAGTSSSMMIGIATASANIGSYVGSDASGWGYNASNGGRYFSGSLTGGYATYSPGDVIGVAYDAVSGKVWFAKNNVWQGGGDPALGTAEAMGLSSGSAVFPMCSILEGSSGQTWLGRFRAADLTYSPPTGFSPWG